MVIESMHEKTEEAICKLLLSLFRSFVITIEQMRNGFERVYDAMPEIAIDVPAAYRLVRNAQIILLLVGSVLLLLILVLC